MNTLAEKYPGLYSQHSISHSTTQSHQMMTISNDSSTPWSRFIAWITNSPAAHQINSNLMISTSTSELQLLTSKSASSSTLTIPQQFTPSTTSTSYSLKVKILSYFLFFLTLIAVIIFAYQTGFYLVLLRNLPSTSASQSLLDCPNDSHHSSKASPNGSKSVEHSSQFLALHAILRDPEHSPSFPIDLNLNLTDLISKKSHQNGASSDKCSHYSCFDIYRCGIANYQSLELLPHPPKHHRRDHAAKDFQNEGDPTRKHSNNHHSHQQQQHIKAYIYPQYRFVNKDTGDDALPPSKLLQSAEFTRLMKAVAVSRYFTPTSARACLYVVNLDLLNAADDVSDLKTIERILWSLPSFAAMSGANHLLFSMLLPPSWFSAASSSSTSSPHAHPQLGIHIGQAMVAAAGFRLSTYRDTFDVSLPGYSLFGQLYSLSEDTSTHKQDNHFNPAAISRLPRRWTVISPQAGFPRSEASESLQYRLQQLETSFPDEVLLLHSGCNFDHSYPADPQVGRLFGHLGLHSTNNSKTESTAYQLYTGAKLCNPDRKIGGLYLDLLHSSEFCLILDLPSSSSSSSSWSLLLSDALMSGCIPVILADNLVLPFEAPLRIDWATASLRIWQHSASRLVDILASVPTHRKRQLRANGLALWQTYFASLEAIATTTLDLINERVYPAPRALFAPISGRQAVQHQTEIAAEITSPELATNDDQNQQPPVQPYRHFSQQSLDFFSTGGYHYISGQEAGLRTAGFTAVILSYNRPDSLMDVIQSVSRAPSCTKILVVWNGADELLKSGDKSGYLSGESPLLRWPTVKAGTQVQLVLTGSNRLSNRFFPYESIETEAVFSIDDDIGMLTADEIEFAYQTWRLFPDRIVGFPSRRHFWANHSSSGGPLGHSHWTYDSEWRNEISLILTGAAFYHNYYNHLYTNVMPASIRDWVDRMMNCEDIAMNFLVSNITCAAPIKVTPRKKFKCPECSKPSPKLSADAMAHLKMRSRCIDYFAQVYGMMPLKTVEFRANPVLFRDNIPDKLKAFTMIGPL